MIFREKAYKSKFSIHLQIRQKIDIFTESNLHEFLKKKKIW